MGWWRRSSGTCDLTPMATRFPRGWRTVEMKDIRHDPLFHDEFATWRGWKPERKRRPTATKIPRRQLGCDEGCTICFHNEAISVAAAAWRRCECWRRWLGEMKTMTLCDDSAIQDYATPTVPQSVCNRRTFYWWRGAIQTGGKFLRSTLNSNSARKVEKFLEEKLKGK